MNIQRYDPVDVDAGDYGMLRVPDGDYVKHDDYAALKADLDERTNECLEQARLNGMGGERELALLARAERAEADRDRLAKALRECSDDLADELYSRYPPQLHKAPLHWPATHLVQALMRRRGK